MRKCCQDLSCGGNFHDTCHIFLIKSNGYSDWEGKGPCAIVPLTWKMAHKSLCRMIRNGPLKISKSLKKAENGPFGKNLFPITAGYNFCVGEIFAAKTISRKRENNPHVKISTFTVYCSAHVLGQYDN